MKNLKRIILITLATIFLIPNFVSADSDIFKRPTDGVVTSDFGYRWGSMHYGLDIAKNGSRVPVVASFDGTVSRSKYWGNYGHAVTIRHNINGKTVETLYAHLKARHINVGDKVSRGTRIGYMGSTGDSTGQHVHFEVHFGLWNGSKSNAVDPKKVLNGDYDSRFGDLVNYKVYHSTQGLLKTFYSYDSAKEYSSRREHSVVIRASDGKQLFANGLKDDLYSVYHSKHKLLAAFSIKQNAIDYSNKWKNTVVRQNNTREQVYARSDMGEPYYEVYHSSKGVIGDFNFDYLARAMSQINPYTIVIKKSSGEQIYKHPEANALQYEVHHTKHGKLTTFSLLSAAKRYSNNWQNTVVIDKVTKKQMYARKDLGWYNYAVRNKKTGEPIASFHFLPNAEDFAKKYREGTVVIDNLND